MPGEEGERTHCWKCKTLLVDRYGFHVRRNVIRQGACPECRTPVDGVGMSAGGDR